MEKAMSMAVQLTAASQDFKELTERNWPRHEYIAELGQLIARNYDAIMAAGDIVHEENTLLFNTFESPPYQALLATISEILIRMGCLDEFSTHIEKMGKEFAASGQIEQKLQAPFLEKIGQQL